MLCPSYWLLTFPMAVSLLHYSFLLPLCFLSPTSFASSCSPFTFTCSNFTSDIQFPFTTITRPLCEAPHMVKCHGTRPLIQLKRQGLWYHLRSISFSEHTLILHDQHVGDPSWASGCSFLYDSLRPITHINITPLTQMLISERVFFNCASVRLGFSHEFLLQFHHLTPCIDYDFHYTSRLDNETLGALRPACLAPMHPLFQWNLSFSEDGGDLSLMSAGFSHQLELRAECFDCRVIGNNCSSNSVCNTGKRNSNTIIIGVASGGAGLLAACCLFLAVYIQKGRKRRSSASSLLLRAICSPLPFKKDPESGSGFYPTQNFSYRELEAATDSFSSSKELGDGGFGTVYKGKLRDGRTVAVKRLYENNYKRVEQFMNEITILSRLHHQNLVSLYGCSSRHSRELLLVYEFVPNGTLADHLHGSRASNGTLTWHVRLNIAIETADALAYLHAVEPPIIHRDVKTNNILLDNGFHVKVADFGLSRLFPADATHVSTAPQGTPGYVDPEYHQCYQLTDKSDVYSFGVVLVELMSSKPAVDVNRHRHEINLANMAVNKMQNNELHELIDPQLGYQSDSEVKNMIERTAELAFRCLNGGGDMRPPIKEVLEVLQVIKKGGNKEEKATERNASSRYGTPMTSGNPCSWDSVSDKSPSRSSTPSTSG